NRSNWDINQDIVKRPLWPYNKSAGIYKCPGDHSAVVVSSVSMPRVRSISMNLFVGGFDGKEDLFPSGTKYRVYLKTADMNGVTGPPDKIFVFLDEREDCINWGNYMTDMNGYSPFNPGAYEFDQDMPAFYHNRGCGFSFADGHSELHRWRDDRTM